MNTPDMNPGNAPPQEPVEKSGKGKRKMMWLLILPIAAYLLIIGLLLVFETDLVYPGKNFKNGDWNPAGFEFEDCFFTSADGTKIHAWYLPKTGAERYVLHCHGNGENVANAAMYIGDELRNSLNANVLVFDYRGFGKSEGSPSENGILEDAVAALEFLNQKTNTTPDQIIVSGHSIGGGPACYLASKKGVETLLLQRTFTSLVDVAAATYSWIPVRMLMRNRYPSAEWIENFDGILFQSHGTADNLIPFAMGQQLFECCPTQKKVFVPLEGLGHNSPFPEGYWRQVADFLDEQDK